MSATGFIAKYGRIVLALAAIFLSGQVIGWMIALHSCEARQSVAADTERWSAQMMARLQDDLDLSDGQSAAVRAKLDATTGRLQQKRDSALFQIHLELIKLHDDLAVGLRPDQQKRLANSRRKLVDSTQRKFPHLLQGAAVPGETQDSAEPTSP